MDRVNNKNKLVIAALILAAVVLFVFFTMLGKNRMNGKLVQEHGKAIKVQAGVVSKPKSTLKKSHITYWKNVIDSQLRNELTVIPTPPKPNLSSVPAEIKALYAKGYVYIKKLRLKSGKEFNIVYPQPLIGIQDNEDRTVNYKEEIRIYNSHWKLIHTITTEYPIFYDLTFHAQSGNLYITSVSTNYDPVIEIYSLHPVRRIHSFLIPQSFHSIKDKTVGVYDLDIVSTADSIIIFYDTYHSFLFVARELTENSSKKIWQGKMPILNSNFHQMINPSKTKIVFSYDSKDDDQNGLLMMDVKNHEVKSLTSDSAKIYHHRIVKWISNNKLIFASQVEGQDDWSLFFMSF